MVDAAFVDFLRSLWVFNTFRGNNVVTADLVSAMNTGKVQQDWIRVKNYLLKLFSRGQYT
jgi:D-3-phosphoglycerate dehydrogenase